MLWLVRLALVFSLLPASFASADDYDKPSPFSVLGDAERPRSDVFTPIVSFVLPGFGQWIDGQEMYGAIYSGAAVAGLAYSFHTIDNNDIAGRREREKQLYEDAGEDYVPSGGAADKDVAERKVAIGQQIYQVMGGMSAYHSFRTAVRTRRPYGQYGFLKYEETPADVLLAPFNFSYLTRSSTLIPLGVIAVISGLQLNAKLPEDSDIERAAFTSADAAFTMGFSYNAGTHEEAMFRGWIQPALREYMGSDLLSNGIASLLFAAAHLGSNDLPIIQAVLGYHLGSVTIDNDWRIGEAVFIHTWWDVFAFASTYHYKRKLPEPAAAALRPVLWMPGLHLVF